MKRSVDELTSSSDLIPFSGDAFEKKPNNNCTDDSKSNNKKTSPRIFDIPQSIFHLIFGDFLQYRRDRIFNLQVFDNAVCNHEDRTKYLSLLENMTIKGFWPVQTVNNLKWLHQRKLRLENVELAQDVTRSVLVEKFPLHWPSAKSWDYMTEILSPSLDAKTFADCLLKCTSLETLKLCLFTDEIRFISNAEEILSYVNPILHVFDDPNFCSHLHHICFRSRYASSRPLYDLFATAMSKYCRNLKLIDFGGTEISHEVLEKLMSTCGVSLEHFFYSFRFDHILKYCPQLTYLPGFVGFNNELIAISQYCPNLIELSIGEVQCEDEDEEEEPDIECDDTSAIAAFERCRNLLKLSIAHCLISDIAIARAADCCAGLTSVSLNYMAGLTIQSLQSMATSCHQLEILKLSNLDIAKEDLRQFSIQYSFPNLTTFIIYNIEVCDQFLLELVRKSPRLIELSLNGSSHITDIGTSHIASYCRNLRFLTLRSVPCVRHPNYLLQVLVNNPKLTYSSFSFYSDFAPMILTGNEVGGNEYTPEIKALLDSRKV